MLHRITVALIDRVDAKARSVSCDIRLKREFRPSTRGYGFRWRRYDPRMSVVVLLRGVNVGGNRTFRPSTLARELKELDVVNIGAAGTFVVRNPCAKAKLRKEFLRRLPFDAEIMLCDGRDVVRLETDNPFESEPGGRDIVRFVSVLAKSSRAMPSMPITLPENGRWLMRLVAARGRFVFGEYRREMRAIGYLGKIDKLLGAPATTRNWNTIMSIVRVVKGEGTKRR